MERIEISFGGTGHWISQPAGWRGEREKADSHGSDELLGRS